MSNIEQRIMFCWIGPMSWMRYLTFYSFRKYNPHWEMVLVKPVGNIVQNKSDVLTTQNTRYYAYNGPDYSYMLSDLDIQTQDWVIPSDVKLTRDEASDIVRWGWLSHNNGIYADTDILWMQPLNPLLLEVNKVSTQTLLCLERNQTELAIGFLGSGGNNTFFGDLYQLSFENTDNQTKFQYFGIMLLRKLADAYATEDVLNAFHRTYPNITIVPDNTVYPFAYNEINGIFEEMNILPNNTYGLHWFGGSINTTKWEKYITPTTWKTPLRNTFNLYTRRL